MNKSVLATLVAAALPSWYGTSATYLNNYQQRKRLYSSVDLGQQEIESSVEVSSEPVHLLINDFPNNGNKNSGKYSEFKLSDLELTLDDLNSQLLNTVVGEQTGSEFLPVNQDYEPALKQGIEFSELLIIDDAVPQQSLFLNSLTPNVAVHRISREEDGLQVLLDILSRYRDLETVRIVSHAESGTLLLGNTRLDTRKLNQHLNDFARVNGAIREGGDLLLYGCDLAKGETGEAFLTLMSGATGWDIAASNNLTGAADKGGDWDLEITTGEIETNLQNEYIDVADFTHVLGLSSGSGTIDMSGFSTGYAATKTYATDGTTIRLSDDTGDASAIYCFGVGAARRCYFDTPGTVAITKGYVDFTGGHSFDITSLYIYNQTNSARTFTITSDQSDSHTTGSIGTYAGSTVSLTGFSGITKLTIAYNGGGNMDAVGIDDLVLANVTAPDTTDPTFNSAGSTPNDNATDVATANDIVVDFDENIAAGTGNVTVRDVTGSSNFQVFDITGATATSSPGAGALGILNDKLYINPTSALSEQNDYSIRIDATAIDDTSGNSFAGITDDTTFNFTTADETAPTFNSAGSTPNDNATAVATANDIVVDFDENIAAGTGNVTVRDVTGSGNFQVFDITGATATSSPGAGALGILNDKLYINPTNALSEQNDYSIRIDATAIDDTSGNSFAGLTDDTTFNFTTADETAPTFNSAGSTPNDNATDVATANDIVVDFDENIAAGTGNVTVRDVTGSGNFEVFDITGATATSSPGAGALGILNDKLYINPTSALSEQNDYSIRIDATAIDDTSGNSFAGITDDTTFNFTTADETAPTFNSAGSTPNDNATDVATANDIVVDFDENIAAGTGNVTVRDVTGSGNFQVFDITGATATSSPGAGALGILNDKLYINPTNSLAEGNDYSIRIDATAIDDTSGNSFAGITDDTTFNFTTAATAATSTASAFNTTNGTNLTPSFAFDGDDETLTIATSGHESGSTADGSTGTDTLVIAASQTVDLTALTSLSGFENFVLNDNASATMTESTHDAWSGIAAGSGTETIILSSADGDATVTGDADIEAYNVNAAITLTIGAAAQNVTGNAGANQTVSVSTLTATGTLAGGTGGTDELQMSNGSSISSATVSGFETLTVASGASVSMTEAQHDAFDTISATGTQQITLSSADGDATVSADSEIENYVLSAGFNITLTAAAQNVTGSSSGDTINVAALTTTGTLNGNGGTDVLSMADGASVAGATLSNFEDLTLVSNASVTMATSQLSQFSGTITAAGAETLSVTGDGDFTTLANIELFSVGDDSSDTRTVTLGAAGTSVTASSASDVVTFDIGTLTYTGTLTGNGSDDIVAMGNGSSIAGATLASVSNLSVGSGATVTMTEAQHDAFTAISGTGTNAINISAATDGVSADTDIESYILGAANSITLTAASQSVTGSTGADTVIAGALTATGTLNAGTGSDTLNLTNGGDISGASVTNFENLTLASGASVSVAASQLSQFSGTITAAGSETLTVSGDGDFSTLAGIELFSVGDDSSNSRTVTVSAAATNVTANSATDAVTFDIGALTYTGTLTGEGTANDTIVIDDGGDISGATLTNIEILSLDSNASATMSAVQYAALSTQTIIASGTETLTISGDGDFTVNSDTVEHYTIDDDTGNARRIEMGTNVSGAFTAASATDAITLDLNSTTFSGSFTADATVANTLVMTTSVDISGATLSGFTNLEMENNGNLTLTVAQLNALSSTITAAGTETLTLSATGSVTGGNLSAIETFATGSGGNITITIPASDVSGKTLIATTSASDSFTVTGASGSQSITGSAGGDDLSGGAGADTIAPSSGTDTMSGGDGNDQFSGSVSDLNGDTISDLAGGDGLLLTGVSGLSTANVRFNGSSTLEIDTNATSFASPEVSITLSAGNADSLIIDSVSDSGSDTTIVFGANNDTPVFSNLDGIVTFTEEASNVVLDSNVTIADTELDALNSAAGDYSGAQLTIARNGGANANDEFDFSSGSVTLSGSNLQSGGQTFGTFSSNSGTLTVTFTSSGTNATSALVDSTLQGITYRNASDDPAASVTLDWTFNDGTANSTGTNQSTVSITAVNDAPTVASAPASVTVTEDITSNVDLSSIDITDVENDTVTLTLSVNEGVFSAPADGASVGSGVTESLVSNTQITLVGDDDDIDTYLNTTSNIQYTTVSNSNTAAVLTITPSDADTGTAATVSIAITSVNDTPTDIALSGTSVTNAASSGTAVGTLSTTDVDDTSFTYSLVSTGTSDAGSCGVDTDNASFGISGSTLQTTTTFTEGDSQTICIQSSDGDNSYQKAFIVTVSDATNPTLSSSSPGDDDVSVAPSANILLAFDDDVSVSSGTITLINTTDSNNVVETFTSGTGSASGTVSASGSTITINPGSDLAAGNSYAIQMDGSAITDTSSNAYAGISNNTTLNFTVSPTIAMAVDTNAISEPGTGEAVITFTLKNSAGEDFTAVEDVEIVPTLGGTGTATTDYTITGLSGLNDDTLTIATGSSSGTFTVTAVGDATDDDGETVIITVGAADNATNDSSVSETITINENTAPTLSSFPTNITITEDEETNIDLSAAEFVDVESDTVVVTMSTDSGVITSPLGTSGSVGVSTVSDTSIIVTGTPGNLNTFFDNENAIAIQTDTNLTDDIPLTITFNDGDLSGNAVTATIVVTEVNDEPTSTAIFRGVFDFSDGEISIENNRSVYRETVSDVTLSVTANSDGAWVKASATDGDLTGSNITGNPAEDFALLSVSAAINFDSITIETESTPTNDVVISPLASDGSVSFPSNISTSSLGTIDLDSWNSLTVITVNADDADNLILDDIVFNYSTSLSDLSFTEDTIGDVNVSLFEIADVDSNNLTLTLSVSSGNFAIPADGASVGAGVTESLLSDTVITLEGASADINSYLDTASNIQYTGAQNSSGDNVATLTISANDGDGSGNVTLNTINIDITAVNDAPEIANFDGDSLSYTEDDAAMALDQNSDAVVTDADSSDFNGGSLTVSITNNHATSEDILTFLDSDVTLSATTSGADVTVDSVVIGTLGSDIVEGNTLTVNFDEDATAARVQTLLRSIAYENSESSIPTESTRTAQIVVNDGTDSSTAVTVSIVVGAENDAPVITGSANNSVLEDNPYSFTPSASDPEGDSLIFSISNQPSWASFSSSTGALSGTPDNDDVGSYQNIVISVSDGTNSTSLTAFSITVVNVNDAPTISGIPATLVAEGSGYSFTPTSSDVDGDSLTFSVSSKPSWASFSTSTGILSGVPDDSDVGTYSNIVISVSDGSESASLSAFAITVTDVNDAPTISGNPATTVDEDSSYSFTPASSDVDGDNLTFSITNKPSWANFSTSSGNLSGTPDNDDVGTYSNIVISVTDGSLTTNLSAFSITVNNVNDAPIITGTADTSVLEGDNYSFIPSATDIDGDSLSFSIENQPAWTSFDTATGQLSGTPQLADVGTHNDISITVSDGELNDSLASFSIEVIPLNVAPVLTDITLETNEDEAVSAELPNEDLEGDALSYSIVSVPESGTVVFVDNVLTYTPAENDNGTITFTYQANDGVDDSNVATATVTIAAVNDVPVITGNPGTSVKVTNDYSFTPTASDIEGDELSFSVVNLPRWAAFDDTTGSISGTPASTDVGTYGNITITVSDGTDGAELAPFNIEVIANEAPVISGAPLTLAPINEAYSFIPQATDEDDENLSFSITNLPSWASFDAATGALSGTPTESDIGTSAGIVISVTDGIDTTSLPEFSIQVCEVCDDVAPVITGTPGNSVTEGQSYSFTPIASDANGDELTFSIENKPDWASFETSTGTLSGTPDEADVGTSTGIVISVTDGNSTVSLPAFSIEVVELNESPVISGAPATSVFQREEYRFTPTASDPDGDTLTFSVENLPGWASFNPTTGTLRGTPVAESVGTHNNVIISVSDGVNEPVALPAFAIEVVARNTAPVISGTPRTAITQGKDYRFEPTATDVDEDILSFSITNQPSWATFDSASGALTGTPSLEDVGTTSGIVISVSDGNESASLNAFSIEVTESNTAPVASDSSATTNEDESLSIFANASDANGDELIFSIVTGPANGELSAISGGWNYTPDANFNGTDSFVYIANDAELDSDSATVNITVNSVNDSPVAVSDSFTVDQNESGNYTLDVLANDTDADIDTAGDSLTIQGARTNLGSVVIVDNQLQYSPGNSFIGSVSLSYSVRDAAGARDRANVTLTINGVSGINAPDVVVPDDVTVDATGLFTKVNLGVASATDADGNPLPVSIVDGGTVFSPGAHTVFWQAEDSFGTTSTESQNVSVNPRISLSKDKTVTEGSSSRVRVILNGDAPAYPFTVPYTVSGTAEGNSIDHDASSGAVTFTTGREQVISFNVFADSEIEADETIVFTLDEGQNRGANRQSIVTISEQNIAPEIILRVTQNGTRRRTVAQDEGAVTITATVSDANPQDSVTTEWSSTITNSSTDAQLFIFDPSSVSEGVYEITFFASDDGDPIQSGTNTAFIEVVDTLTVLSDTEDSDGDLIPDSQEGFADSDGDGIPDYLDAIEDCNVVPEQAATQDGFLIESDPGVCLRQGASSALNSSDGLQVIADEAGQRKADSDGVVFVANNLPEDTSAANIGGIFDFVLYELPEEGQSVNIVIPQTQPVPKNAVYRKYKASAQEWGDFVSDDNNAVFSTAGEQGVCPPPGEGQWVEGLVEGSWCIQLQIQDGGPNDDDGQINGAIVDPGGVAVVLDNNTLPIAVDDSVTMQWNTSAEVDVLANDSDADDDILSVVNVAAAFGDVVVNADSTITYTPNNGFVGADRIVYAISDGNNGTSSAEVNVTINGNRAPGAIDDSADTDDLTAIEIDVLANDIDVDGDMLKITVATVDVGAVTITDNNTLIYQPEQDYTGVATITYTVSDTFGESDTGTVLVTVDGNQAPVAVDDTVTTAFNTSVTFDVIANDEDQDGDSLFVTQVLAERGSVIVNNDNTLTYTPPTGFSGEDTIVYTVSDGLLTSEASVTVVVQEEPIETITVSDRSGGGSVFWLLISGVCVAGYRHFKKLFGKGDRV